MLPASLDVSATNCQRALDNESEMIRTHMGTHNGSEMVAVLRPPHEPSIVTIKLVYIFIDDSKTAGTAILCLT
jgi:hypothetical protein